MRVIANQKEGGHIGGGVGRGGYFLNGAPEVTELPDELALRLIADGVAHVADGELSSRVSSMAVEEAKPPEKVSLERVVVDAELREKLMAPLCHRVAIGDVVTVVDVTEPLRGRVLILHRAAGGADPAWILAETGEVGYGTIRKELMEGTTVILDGGQPAIVLALTGAVVPLPPVEP
jgi:hypothetical protein